MQWDYIRWVYQRGNGIKCYRFGKVACLPVKQAIHCWRKCSHPASIPSIGNLLILEQSYALEAITKGARMVVRVAQIKAEAIISGRD